MPASGEQTPASGHADREHRRGVMSQNPIAQTRGAAPAAITRGQANYALAALFVLYILNFIDRQLLNLYVADIGNELGVSDKQMGLLIGVAFVLFYTVAGIPLARWGDRGSRTLLITLGLAVWSGMTALSGLARSYTHLLLARIGVGVGEASFTPCSHSLITDYFPAERRATALAIFAAGASFGNIIGFAGGGWIGQEMGWRAAFLIIGLVGLPVALVFRLTVPEPPRALSATQAAAAQRDSVWAVYRYLASSRAFVFLAISASLHGFSSFGSQAWVAALLRRVHELSLVETGLVMAMGGGVGAAIGQILAGRSADRLGGRNVLWYMYLPAITSLVSLPLLILFLFSWNFTSALWLYLPAAGFAAMWTGPTYAMTQALVQPHMRATAAATIVFLLNLVGLGLGPFIVGALNDWLAPTLGATAVRYSLLFASVPHALASIFNLLAARHLVADLERAKQERKPA
jgi:predicted MFS family arabinose efflux permease